MEVPAQPMDLEKPSQLCLPPGMTRIKLKKGEHKKSIVEELKELADEKICAPCAAEYWLQVYLSKCLSICISHFYLSCMHYI